MPAESPAPSVVLLAFAGGFALATLIFWPMLHRARTRQDRSAAPTGKHARRPEQQKAIAPKAIEQKAAPARTDQKGDQQNTGQRPTKPSTGSTAVSVPATVSATAVTAAGSAAEGSEEGATPSPAPSTAESAPSDGAEAPPVKDLFEEHYGPKFDLVRERLMNLREQINGEC
jgi:hypothetical protein